MTVRRGLTLALIVAVSLAVLATCNSASTTTCPGTLVGTYQFTGTLFPDSGSCLSADASISFTADITYGSGSLAYVCVHHADAEALTGSHDGGALTVTYAFPTLEISSCTCAVQIQETLAGELIWSDAGTASFTGTLTDRAVAGPDAGSCEKDAGADAAISCGVPCAAQWNVTGS